MGVPNHVATSFRLTGFSWPPEKHPKASAPGCKRPPLAVYSIFIRPVGNRFAIASPRRKDEHKKRQRRRAAPLLRLFNHLVVSGSITFNSWCIYVPCVHVICSIKRLMYLSL